MITPAFIVDDSKPAEFLAQKRDTKAMLEKFERLRKIDVANGVSETDAHIVFLDKKIKEFRAELNL